MSPEDTSSRQAPDPAGGAGTPVIRPGRSLRWSWVWLVPLLALAVGLSLLVSVWVRSGPVITISFSSAAGVEAGQTKLRYRDVVVGDVLDVRVAEDRRHVLVDVQLRREGSEYITQENSKFWIVSPQVSVAGISGLDTLLSGVYLTVDAPTAPPEGDPVRVFNDRGDFEGLARVTEDVGDGVIVATLGYWRSLNRSDGSVNSISSAEFCSLGHAPTFSDNLVQVTRVN